VLAVERGDLLIEQPTPRQRAQREARGLGGVLELTERRPQSAAAARRAA
jgi:hypothetical protein